MFDTSQWWQSDTFRKMLNYERENNREKFIYDVNQMLIIILTRILIF